MSLRLVLKPRDRVSILVPLKHADVNKLIPYGGRSGSPTLDKAVLLTQTEVMNCESGVSGVPPYS